MKIDFTKLALNVLSEFGLPPNDEQISILNAAFNGAVTTNNASFMKLVAEWRDKADNAPKSFAGPHRPIGALNRWHRFQLRTCADELERAAPQDVTMSRPRGRAKGA